MVSPLFGIDIKGLIAKEIVGAGGLNPGTLTIVTHGSRTNSTSGRAQSTGTATFQGIVSRYRDKEIDGTQVQRGDKRILIIAGTLNPAGTVPKTKDRITIEGITYEIMGVPVRDPAEATYTVQGRGGGTPS